MARRDERLEVLIGTEEIGSRVRELAAEISADYRDAEDLLLVGVLRGCFIFLADLARELSIPNRVDFIAVQSYGDRGSAQGAVRLLMDLRTDIQDRHVLVVEDIIDSGLTMSYLLETLSARRPSSLKTCVLVTKRRTRPQHVPVDYLGFEIPDEWVVGYGLDYANRYRTLPHIAILKREGGDGTSG